MRRTLQIEIDQSTWPTPPAQPAFPAAFAGGSGPYSLDILGMLLHIGRLTTPSHPSGVSLSEFWAYIRYLHAVSTEADLRLTTSFANLDSHQKTILSDDFGMGAPACWLAERLAITKFVDGRDFINRYAAAVGATADKPKKRGPGKSPDFVGRDVNGVWHVLECKGTQSGRSSRKKQLGQAGASPTGAIAQKRTINFPSAYTGQRLASGLVIGVSGGAASSLKIIDPPGDEVLAVDEGRIADAEEALERANLAQSLRLAGFAASGLAVSAPWGSRPQDRPTSGLTGRRREAIAAANARRAREELGERFQRMSFEVGAIGYRGREVTFVLPFPVVVEGRAYRKAHVRQGVPDRLLEEIAETPTFERAPVDLAAIKESRDIPMKLISSDANARLVVGATFVSEIDLEA